MLEQAKIQEDQKNMICTITGDSGVGKTSFAATFPKPLFICVEDGIKSIPKEKRPPSLPLVRNVDNLWAQLKAVIDEQHDYKTIVIDSVTQLDILFTEKVLTDSNTNNIARAEGGFGAGYSALSALHARVRRFGEKCLSKGLNVVFIAHADMQMIDLPDAEPYSRYTVKLHKKSLSHYVDNVDLVGQVRLESFIDKDKRKAKSDGTRVLRCYANVSGITKNRYGITKDIELKPFANPFIESKLIGV